jgi:peptidoglycan-associated lipoprotein
MTTTQLSRSALLAAVFMFALAGCSSVNLDEQKPAPIVDAAPVTATKTDPDPRAVAPVDAQAGRGLDPLNDPNNPLSKRSVFFDFDSFVVKDEYRPLVEAHARYLAGNRQARATIQGNTDERGSREYNIALGQRRADAVKRMMTLLGAQDAQVETVSFGKEKPRNPGHDEAAWAQNRRGDIVHAGE